MERDNNIQENKSGGLYKNRKLQDIQNCTKIHMDRENKWVPLLESITHCNAYKLWKR